MQPCYAIASESGPLTARFERGCYAAEPLETAEPARILYAEDNDEVRELAALFLRHAGYTVSTAADGMEAWAMLQINHFDLLITDNDMPGLTGLELIAKARQAEMTLEVILASGGLGEVRGLVLGKVRLRAQLRKPYSRDELLSMVRDVLEPTGHMKQPVALNRRLFRNTAAS